jgi:succinylglutamic semialdehyde dehydrogenase
MGNDLERWRNRCPGDLSIELNEITATPVEPAVQAAIAGSRSWRRMSLEDRCNTLVRLHDRIRTRAEDLAGALATETGKPIGEARGEMAAVVAKIDLTIQDARRWLSPEPVLDGPHPAEIRKLPRGPAAVIAPFNFPLHLGHGAAMAYLAAGNPVLFKPSPRAAGVCALYGQLAAAVFPPGVFQIVQGWSETGRILCLHPEVRSICFTGSVAAGKSLVSELAGQFDKDLALELGGKNAAIVCEDADLKAAAAAITEAACLTAGQRCNSTSRVLVHQAVADSFLGLVKSELAKFVPGHPLDERTNLGPLISEEAVERYRSVLKSAPGQKVLPGEIVPVVDGKRGYYVKPALVVADKSARDALCAHSVYETEIFAPIVVVIPWEDEEDLQELHDRVPYRLSAAIFTRSRSRFERLASKLHVGNVYANLPTTSSPSTLPFGGLGLSGNRHPGGRGFIRFAADEQSVQWREGEFD